MRREELSSLTGIRFYAALGVYLCHIHLIPGAETFTSQRLLFNLGDAGVSFFFVLSGFILTYNYADMFRAGVSSAAYAGFVWDRLTKIYPVHVLTLLLVLPIAIASPQLPFDWRAVPVHLALWQCFWPASIPAFSDQLNVPSWSISCEWFFYLLAPVTIFVVLGNRRRWVPIVVVAGYAGGLAFFLWHGQPDSVRVYFVSRFAPSRFVEFLAGVFAARSFLASTHLKPVARSGLSPVAGIALILAAAYSATQAGWPLSSTGLVYLPGSVLLILGLVRARGFLEAHLSHAWLKRLGTASFSLYLVHVPVLRVVKGLCLRLGYRIHSAPAFWTLLIGVFVVVQAAAFLVCAAYEYPMQKRLRSLLANRRETKSSRPPEPFRATERVAPGRLLLVAHGHPEILRRVQASLANEPGVKVLMDRRLAERRRRFVAVVDDRRQTHRRARPEVDSELRNTSSAIISQRP